MDSWSDAEKNIYDLIARRFIGMFLEDKMVVQQKAKIRVDGSDFACTGEKLIEAGWSAVDKNIGNVKGCLPAMRVGDSVAIKKMWIRTDETAPPAPHTEASLLVAMEHAGSYMGEEDNDDMEMEFGIGTPATRARTIEKLIEKEMVVRKGRALIPTEYGIKLVSILPDVLRSPELTGKWEAELTKIAKGKESPEAFMTDLRTLTTEVVDFTVKHGKTNLEEAKYVGKCPVCGNWVKEYPNAYYCINKTCGFRPIYKAVKGFHPTLFPLAMRELLENKTAVTEKGTFSIIEEKPYIAFEKVPDIIPDYKLLKELIEYYGLHYVNNVSKGGALWIAGDQDDELMQDFVKECKAAGCVFTFKADPNALKGKPGWYLRVKPEHKNAFLEVFQNNPKNLKQVEKTDFCLVDHSDSQTKIDIIDGHIEGSYFWVTPVRIIDYSNMVTEDNVLEFRECEISVHEEYLKEYLCDFLLKHFDDDLEANRNRRSLRWIDSKGKKHYVMIIGFEWYATYNFYTFETMNRIIEDIKQVICDLKERRETEFTSRLHVKHNLTAEELTYSVGLNPAEREKFLASRRYIDYSEDESIIDFYNRFICRMEHMMKIGQENGFDLISFTAY